MNRRNFYLEKFKTFGRRQEITMQLEGGELLLLNSLRR